MFTLDYVKSPQWADAQHSVFECVVKFDEFADEMPFGCTSADKYEHSKEIWTRTLAGEFGEILEYVPPTIDQNGNATQPQPTTEGAQTL